MNILSPFKAFSFNSFEKNSTVEYAFGSKTQGYLRRHQKNKNKAYKLSLLIVVMVLAILSIGVGGIFAKQYVSKNKTGYQKIKWNLEKKENLLKQTLVKLEIAQQQIAVLVEGRIPKLQPLIYDEAIVISERYIRDVIFTQTGPKLADRIFEYRIVMENDSAWIVTPKVQILLFNEIGVQVGMGAVTRNLAINKATSSSLVAGEVRTYSSTIALHKSRGTAHYFLFEFQDS